MWKGLVAVFRFYGAMNFHENDYFTFYINAMTV